MVMFYSVVVQMGTNRHFMYCYHSIIYLASRKGPRTKRLQLIEEECIKHTSSFDFKMQTIFKDFMIGYLQNLG